MLLNNFTMKISFGLFIVATLFFISTTKHGLSTMYNQCYIEKAYTYLFIGVPNPIHIQRSSNDKRPYFLVVGSDTIELKGEQKTVNIYVSSKERNYLYPVQLLRKRGDNTFELLTEKGYKVRKFPNPVPYVFSNEKVSKREVQAAIGVSCLSENWNININFSVSSFSVLARIQDKDTLLVSKTSRFTKTQKQYFEMLESGEYLIIKDIKVQMPTNKTQVLSPLIYEID